MDLIDRQALLKQIDIDSDGEPGYYGDTWKFIDTIKSLPSATDKNVGTKLGTNLAEVGTDCISRQSAIDALRKLREEDIEDYGCEIPEGFNQDHLDRATFAIKQLPSAQPEIIRCRECKFASGDSRICMKFDHSPIGELDFCSFAERREVNNESD